MSRYRIVEGGKDAGRVDPPSGGDDPPGMEARVAKLESDVGHIQADVNDIKTELRSIRADMRTDFRWLIAGIAGSFLILAGMMASGFLYGVKTLGDILQRLPPPH